MIRIRCFLMLAVLLACCGGLLAQETPDTPTATPVKARPPANSKTRAPQHRFWDTENICLFSGVAATRMLDYASTRHLRNQGNPEWLLSNSIVDNRPLFVGIELAGTAVNIGVAYLFYRTGHHSLERWVSIVHIGVGVGGSIHNYALTPPPTVQPVMPGLRIQPGR